MRTALEVVIGDDVTTLCAHRRSSQPRLVEDPVDDYTAIWLHYNHIGDRRCVHISWPSPTFVYNRTVSGADVSKHARMKVDALMDSQPDRLLVPYDDARPLLGGIGRTLLWELVSRGELTKVNIGRRAFITAKSIAAYVDRLEAASATAR